MRSNWMWMVVALAAIFAFAPRSQDATHAEPMAFAARETAPVRAYQRRDLDCRDFGSHDEAQAFFEENGAHEDTNRLDGDGDGIACERLR